MATRTARKTAAPVVEVVEDEFEEMEETEVESTEEDGDIESTEEDDDLEELEEVEEEETTVTPTKSKATKAKSEKAASTRTTIEFGSPWLAQHINSTIEGEKYDARAVRMLLRKLAKDGVLPRKVGEDRERYSFSGPEDATVKAVITMVKDGSAKALKQAGLEKVKADAAAKKAAKAAAKAAEAEDEEIEEVEEAPAPKIRRAPAKAAAAPAKATPSTRRKAPAKA